MKKYYYLFSFCCLFVSSLYSQNDTIKNPDRWDDYKIKPADTSSNYGFGNKRFINFENKFDFSLSKYERPVLEIQYGFTNPSYHEDALSSKLTSINMLEARLGYMELKYLKKNTNLINMNFSYIFGGYYNIDLGSEKRNSKEILTEAIKFGYSIMDGYGWKIGESSDILLTHAKGISWVKLKFNDSAVTTRQQVNLDVFGDKFRFGSQFEGGLRIRLVDNLSVNAGYERSIVFPRHMFWYWTLSELIEASAQGLVDTFGNETLRNSSNISPIAYFILKNAISYGMFELRRKNMNWPTETVPPFMFDTYKVGFSLVF